MPNKICVTIFFNRLNTRGIWTTSQSADIKKRGYIEVRSTFPATSNGKDARKFKGAWPAIWLMGESKLKWPHNGEIDILETINGEAKIYASLHSTNHNGGNSQHPPKQPFQFNSDFVKCKDFS